MPRLCLQVLLLLAPLVSHAAQPTGGDERWAKYDFIPGDSLLFFEDFAKPDKKGPLARLVKPGERLDVKERNGAKWLHCRPPCAFDVVLPEKAPARFTIDFDMLNPSNGGNGQPPNGVIFSMVNANGSDIANAPQVGSSPSTMSYANGGEGANNEVDRLGGIDGEAVLHFSWLFDGSKTQGYIEHLAALNVADLAMPRTARVHFTFPGGDDPDLIAQNAEVWLTNLRIAGGGNPALFDELSKKGHVALPGILFDSGSDRIRPESTPALAAVAKMLAEHPELKVTIEGHTDAEGKPAANRVLSEKRATAVQAWLVQKHMVAATRLSPKGFGQEKPVASNATSEGRQANRRVELVKVVSP